MPSVNLVFPHQLFELSTVLENGFPIFLIEEHLYFNHYAFHKQKIAFHRASMKYYETYLLSRDLEVNYIDAQSPLADVRQLILELGKNRVDRLFYIDPTDNWLQERIQTASKSASIECIELQSPLFLNSVQELQTYFHPGQNKLIHANFYIAQRRQRNILLDESNKPIGGKWSFDTANRRKYPRKKTPPIIDYPPESPFTEEAKRYTLKNFGMNPGTLKNYPLYPIDHAGSQQWLNQFLLNRFAEFGDYEDAIVVNQHVLHHSVLSPIMNAGLITPTDVLQKCTAFTEQHNIPLNSSEGFIRQIVGWREFIRGIYQFRGANQRTQNFWQFKRKLPSSFYNADTGVEPVDDTIRKVMETGYCHHIERLMVLGNFMLLCEINPDEVYRWFMELFIDAYDWVMVPNVYGMSQFADGGSMSTKPYISGSNYLVKMSNYPKGSWQEVWDALFWRFLHVHRDFFLLNPRLAMLVKNFDKMPEDKQLNKINTARQFLQDLDCSVH